MNIKRALVTGLCIGCSIPSFSFSVEPEPGRFQERHDSVGEETLPTNGTAHSGWVEVHVDSQILLIAKIADATHFPEPDEKPKSFFKKSDASKLLFYLYIPNAFRGSTVELHGTNGKTQKLPKPQLVFRMPGSGLYIPFLWDPSRDGFLLITCNGSTSKIDLGRLAENLGDLPFFWNGQPPRIAIMDLPPWMKSSMP
jgi:hypothetical protein